MGTYTTNYNLFMPSIGEQGWGELVNGNFTTIDATMAGLNTRVGTLETETDAMEERVDGLDSRITTLENTIPEEGVIEAENIVATTLTLPLNYNGDISLWSNSITLSTNSSGVINSASLSCPLKNTGSIRYSGTYYVGLSMYSFANRTVTVYVDNVVYETFTITNAYDNYNPLVKNYNLPITSTIRVTTTGSSLGAGGSLSGSAKI